MDYNYIYILIGIIFASYLLPLCCLHIVAGNSEQAKERLIKDKGLFKYLTVVCFIIFSIIFFSIYYSQKQRDIEQEKCNNSNGVYVFRQHKDNICIEKNAHDEYQSTVHKAYQKYMNAEIKLK